MNASELFAELNIKDRYNWQLTVQALLSIYRKVSIMMTVSEQNDKR
jgi:hypothetical protein